MLTNGVVGAYDTFNLTWTSCFVVSSDFSAHTKKFWNDVGVRERFFFEEISSGKLVKQKVFFRNSCEYKKCVMTTRSEENYVGKCNEIPNAEKDLVYFQRYRHF